MIVMYIYLSPKTTMYIESLPSLGKVGECDRPFRRQLVSPRRGASMHIRLYGGRLIRLNLAITGRDRLNIDSAAINPTTTHTG